MKPFVPPSPLQLLDHLQAWEAYVHSEAVDTLIQTAIVHAQFELLHPFKDGNGRIGRLLIPLLLHSKGMLCHPSFYLSAYLEHHRDNYYSHLRGISQKGGWVEWLRFFLTAVIEQAKDNLARIQLILNLYEEMKAQIAEVTHSRHGIRLLDAIFHRPIFQASDLVQRTELPKQTLMPLLRKMKGSGILADLRKASGRQPGILTFPKLLNITEGRSVFS